MCEFMLSIGIRQVRLEGFRALDFRRARALRDAGLVTITTYERTDVSVDEGFARTWFGGDFVGAASVDIEWLAPGEIEDAPHPMTPHNVRVASGINPVRARELFIRARTEQAAD
jgi:hypothetical protein